MLVSLLRFDPPDRRICPQLSPDARSDGSSTLPDHGSPARATSAGLYFHTQNSDMLDCHVPRSHVLLYLPVVSVPRDTTGL
jgi:hypothetical protein